MILLRNFHATLIVQTESILNARNVNCLRTLLKVEPLKQTISLLINGNKWIAGRKRYPYRLMLRMFLPSSICMLKHGSVTFIRNVFNIWPFNNLKSNLKERKEILIQVDYSEYYVNKDQAQIQSAYFGQKSFSIFTTCYYLKCFNYIRSKRPFKKCCYELLEPCSLLHPGKIS